MSVKIITGFDGSGPCDDAGVTIVAKNEFVLRPGHRHKPGRSEETDGCGSRFSTRLRNTASRPAPVTVTVDWSKPDRTAFHDIGYYRHEREQEWTMIPGERSGARVIYRLTLKQGRTHLGLYPEYNVAQCERWLAGLKRRGVTVTTIGHSREKRPISMIKLPSSSAQAVNFFLQTRDHAYETAGSNASAGIVEFLLTDSPLVRYLRSKFNFFVVPMTNPDGVFNGLSRLTWEQGADMNRIHTVRDAAHAALKAALDSVRPKVHMNIHNWTYHFEDGLLSNDADMAKRIQAHFPADHKHYKRWLVRTTADFLKQHNWTRTPPEHQSWKNYCKEHFGARGVNFEFPWFMLNTAEMRAKGVQALVAYALAAIELEQW